MPAEVLARYKRPLAQRARAFASGSTRVYGCAALRLIRLPACHGLARCLIVPPALEYCTAFGALFARRDD
eukprot:6151661-Pyramimonas_sp.AAC.1